MNGIFLGIGAQKAGTSWLHRCLSTHPDIWMPPVKELHFFDDLDNERHATLAPRIATRSARVGLREFTGHIARNRDWSVFGWGLRYFLLPRSISWYRKILSHPSRLLVGDITPAYAIVSAETVQLIADNLPHVRAIIILRNPVDRAFSHAAMDLARTHRGNLSTLPVRAFYDHFQSSDSRRRTDYIGTIDRWHRILGRERLFVAFFEEIADTPVRLLEKITEFLEMTPIDWSKQTSVDSRVNAGGDMKIPSEFRTYLANMYRKEITELAERYGTYAEAWAQALPDA